MTVKERLLDRCEMLTESGCWIWTGPLAHGGYGKISLKDTSYAVHRVAYSEFVGEIPDGLNVCHTCDVPACFNPCHLFIGTQKQNMEDASRKKRMANQKRTECPQGHPYTAGNVFVYGGRRTCRACKNTSRHVRVRD